MTQRKMNNPGPVGASKGSRKQTNERTVNLYFTLRVSWLLCNKKSFEKKEKSQEREFIAFRYSVTMLRCQSGVRATLPTGVFFCNWLLPCVVC